MAPMTPVEPAGRRSAFVILAIAGTIAIAACGQNRPQTSPTTIQSGGAATAISLATGGGSLAVPAISPPAKDAPTACPTEGIGGDPLPPLCALSPSPSGRPSVQGPITPTPLATPTPTPTPTSKPKPKPKPTPTPKAPPTATDPSTPRATPTPTAAPEAYLASAENVSPSPAPDIGGDIATIEGTSFYAEVQVFFGGIPAEPPTFQSGTEIIAATPHGPFGGGRVDITAGYDGWDFSPGAPVSFAYETGAPTPTPTPSSAWPTPSSSDA
jgi:IPT/TIG domain